MNPRTMRLLIVVTSAALLIGAGCSSLLAPKPDLTRFYLLTSLTERGTRGTELPHEPGLGDLSLGLGPIQLPGYLDREHIVTRVSPNRITVAAFDRWAEPLASGMNRVLTENLTMLLGTKKICTYPFSRPGPDYQIQIDIVRFEPTYDQSADLAARWYIKDGETKQVLYSYNSHVKRPAKSALVSGAVDALSDALGELSTQIAAALSKVHSTAAAARPRVP